MIWHAQFLTLQPSDGSIEVDHKTSHGWAFPLSGIEGKAGVEKWTTTGPDFASLIWLVRQEPRVQSLREYVHDSAACCLVEHV